MDFEHFFDHYVVDLMLPDVSREIANASRGENAGNFLCALGLLTYTEVMGGHVHGVGTGSRKRFETFFSRLGPCYKAFLDSGEDPYKFYRCGMVHEYVAKGPCTVAMFDPDRIADCGVGAIGDHYHFVVERYFQDFVLACARLYKERMGHRHSRIHVWAPHLFPYAQGQRGVNEDLR